MPGVSREQVQDHTGFDLSFCDDSVPFQPLSGGRLDILNGAIDPMMLRKLEVYSGEERLDRIEKLASLEPARQILQQRITGMARRVA